MAAEKPKKPAEFVTYAADGLGATIELAHEYTFSGAPARSLTMRRGRVRDQKAAAAHSSDPVEREVFLFASLCGVTPAELEELYDSDYERVAEAYVGFRTRS